MPDVDRLQTCVELWPAVRVAITLGAAAGPAVFARGPDHVVRLSLVGNRAKDAVDVIRVAEIVDLIAWQCGRRLVVHAPARYAIDALC